MPEPTETLLTYAQLDGAPDQDLADFIRSDLHCEPEEVRFRLTTIDLVAVADYVTWDPGDYLADNNEDAYHLAVGYGDLYHRNGPDALPPVVFHRDKNGRAHILDGYKRLSGASSAELPTLPAYEAFVNVNSPLTYP